MEELGNLWGYSEGIDELKQRLLYATLELESVKMEANQEIVKNKENIKNLMNLLQMAYKERDEAKNQLQKLVNRLMMMPLPSQYQVQTITHLIIPTKPNSSISESNSLSDTYNPQSHGSSPADSFFDTVSSSPDLSNINIADSYNVNDGFGIGNNHRFDQTCLIIDDIVKGKKLPEKGKLLQAVMEAGPLLQTLLVAGPLPRWRNPPPLQPFKIPPVSMAMANAFEQKPDVKPLSSQMCSTSMLNFSSGSSGSCYNNAMIMMSAPSSSLGSQIQAGKQERFY